MKVIITNTVALNGGDAAILTAIARLLTESYGEDLELSVLDSQPEVAARYYPEFRFLPLLYDACGKGGGASLRRELSLMTLARGRVLGSAVGALIPEAARSVLDAYQSANLVVSTGGTYLIETYNLEPRLLEFRLAEKLGLPVVFFTQSLGPFTRRRNRRELMRHFSRSPLILLRDQVSKAHLEQLGLDTARAHVHGDCVFSLAKPARVAQLAHRRLPPTGMLVLVSVRHWPHLPDGSEAGMRRYLRAVAGIVEHLVSDRGARVKFVSTCQGVSEYRSDDSKTAHEVVELLSSSSRQRVEVDESFHTPLELVGLFGEADMVCATRMHAAILALIAGTPVLPIAYEFKTTELFAALDFADLTLNMDTVTEADAVDVVQRFLGEVDGRRSGLRAAVEAQVASAGSVVSRLRQVVPGSPRIGDRALRQVPAETGLK